MGNQINGRYLDPTAMKGKLKTQRSFGEVRSLSQQHGSIIIRLYNLVGNEDVQQRLREPDDCIANSAKSPAEASFQKSA